MVSLYADLIVIKLEEFYIILGMDWLARHHTILNCYTKEIVIDMLGHRK